MNHIYRKNNDKPNHKSVCPSTIEHVVKIREIFGENDIYEPFDTRPWFTNMGQLYVRNDLLDHPQITLFILKYL